MKTIYKVVKSSGVRNGENLFSKEWYCSTKKLAEAFKAEKEKSEQPTDVIGNVPRGNGYHVVAVEVMDSEDDFYKKELR